MLLISSLASGAGADMPLETHPAWESTANGKYATGGAWSDIDGDGWLDMVVANGNDMARQAVAIYHNNGDGTLPLNPTWSASDIDYHGHLDVGDINGDGLPDVAVAVYIGPGGFAQPGRVKVYYNNGTGAFNSQPDWASAEDFYCFSVALGDVNGDGRLDLACACGDDYYNNPERQRIFFNTGTGLETNPGWLSDECDYALDVFWGDIDEDGDQDLVFCGTSSPMRAYLNAQTAGGGLSTSADWESSDLPQYGNTTALGDWNGDGFPEVAVADNNQLGGSGYFKVYANQDGSLTTDPAWHSVSGGYGSHVSWIDLDLDGDPDLAAGRWWGAGRIFENTGGMLAGSPIWISSTNSVIENMFWGDVDNDALLDNGQAIANGDGARTLFMLGQAPIRSVDAVLVDGIPQPAGTYAVHRANGWISFAIPPPAGAGNVRVQFSYSCDLDLGVTNWDPSRGNYLFLNSAAAAVDEPRPALVRLRAFPNPLRARTRIRYNGSRDGIVSLAIYDVSGALVRTLHRGPLEPGLVIWEWDRHNDTGQATVAGVYFARLVAPDLRQTIRLIALR